MTPCRPLAGRFAPAILLLLATAQAQTPPCLGPFQRVDAFVPVTSSSVPVGLNVDGHDAVLWVESGFGYPREYTLHIFREDPASGIWSATESRRYPGPTYNNVALDDGVLAYMHFDTQTSEVVALERDPVTGTWQRIGAVPMPTFPSLVDQLLVSRELIAFGSPPRAAVWRRGPGGYTLAARFTGEVSQLEIEGERVVRVPRYNGFHAELYRCPASGGIELLGYVQAPAGTIFRGPALLHGERLLAPVGAYGANSSDGLASWRIAWDSSSGADAVLDSVGTYGVGLPTGSGLGCPSFGADSLLSLNGRSCGGSLYDSRSAALVDVDAQGRFQLAGIICVDIVGFWLPGCYAATDGNTVAKIYRDLSGRASVEFARYLGAAHDRDRDCVRDTDQIRADPRLDLNVNARLDAYERVGESFCAQLAPNSTGAFASLELIGSEHTASTDLAAVARALPPLALVTSTFTFAPEPLPAQATTALGLCLAGARHPAVASDTSGVAVTPIRPSTLPSSVGTASALAGQTWAWQHVYRDGANLAATPAVAVRLW